MTIHRLSELERLLQHLDEVDSVFYLSLHPDDRKFLRSKLEGLPYAIQKIMFNNYRSAANIVKANTDLRIASAEIDRILPVIFRLNFDMCENAGSMWRKSIRAD
jgi:hypothetical protein